MRRQPCDLSFPSLKIPQCNRVAMSLLAQCTSPPNLPPSRIHSSTSLYAVSRSSFTTILSCTPASFENAISASACFSRFCTASSLSVFRPLRRCSRTWREGGDRKRKRALRSLFLTCLTPYIVLKSTSAIVEVERCGNDGTKRGTYFHLNI